MSLDELEAQTIASGFERNQLAVYADALQSSATAIDQLRGELIAFDLQTETKWSPDSDLRRRELLARWLGDLAPHVRCEWGFLHLSLDRTISDPYFLAKFLASTGAPFLRGIELYGEHALLREWISLLGGAPRRRLAGLSIAQISTADQPTVTGRMATTLIRATPALHTIAVRGYRVLGAFPHPTVRTLRVAGWNAIGSLVGEGNPLPALEDLDFAFHRDLASESYSRPHAPPLERMLRGVPALRRLDLSRNERSDASYTERIDIFGFLRDLAIKKRLTHLRVPSIQTIDDRRSLQSSLDRMPELVELEVARLPPPPLPNTVAPPPFELTFTHAAKQLLPTRSAWIPRNHSRGRDTLAVEVPYHPYRLTVDLLDAVKHLEMELGRLRPDTRHRWTQFWTAIDRLGFDGQGSDLGIPQRGALPVEVLAVCCATMTETRWRAVRSALAVRPMSGKADVRVMRLWSYDS